MTLLAPTLKICAAAAILSGCSSTAPQQAFAPLADSQTNAVRRDSDSRALRSLAREKDASWIARGAITQDLLYVSDVDEVVVYSYPQGIFKGRLRRFLDATGVCVDKNGDVFVADNGYGRVYEYKHGGTKRIKTLYPGDAVGCSVDPTTGNLAVTDLQSTSRSGNGNVAIFVNASGKPKYYTDPAFHEYFFCGYDDKGNLFVDGLPYGKGTGYTLFAELPKGGSTFKDFAVNAYVAGPGGVQWDGKHVAIGDQYSHVYEFNIDESKAILVGTTPLGDAKNVKQAWIQGDRIIAPNSVGGPGANVLIYKYPAGGEPIKTIKGVEQPQGAAVSTPAT